jgi:hypothetical protein
MVSSESRAQVWRQLVLAFAVWLLLCLSAAAAFAQGFTPNTLVAYRVGTGAQVLNAIAQPVFLDEINPVTGAILRSVSLPAVAVSPQRALTAVGADGFSDISSADGLITRSLDRRFLVLTGYDAAAGTFFPPDFLPAFLQRTVGRVDSADRIDFTLGLTDCCYPQIRSAVSIDGSAYWVAGDQAGVRYVSAAGGVSVRLNSDGVHSIRQLRIFDGQLFVSASRLNPFKLSRVGTGVQSLPAANLVGVPGVPTSNFSPTNFEFLDLDPSHPGVDVLYVASEGEPGSNRGISKFYLSGAVWLSAGSHLQGKTYGLASAVDDGVVTLYSTVVGADCAGTPAARTSLCRLIDRGARDEPIKGESTLLASSAVNRAWRGIAWSPEAELLFRNGFEN